MEEYGRIWKQILEEISKKVTSVSYDMWFSKLEPLDVSYGKLVLIAPLKSIQKTLSTQEYKNYISSAIKTVDNPMVTDYIILNEEEKEEYLSSSSELNSRDSEEIS